MTGNPFMSLFTIFHSREFTVIDPGWHRLGSAAGPRLPSRRQAVRTERAGEPSGARVFTPTSCSAATAATSPRSQLPRAVAWLFPSRLRNAGIGAAGRPGCAGSRGDALRLASGRGAPPARPRLPGGSAAGARGPAARLQVMRGWRLLRRRAVF